jgi:hypothetical protein
MPTSLHVAIFAILSALPVSVTPRGHTPESEAARAERLDVIALAIDDVSRTPEQAAVLIVLAYEESRLDPLIHAGLKHPVWTQDRGRARSLWQLHRSGLVRDWDTIGGTDLAATTRAARDALRVVNSASYMCAHSSLLTVSDAERAIAAYGSGSGNCTPTVKSRHRAQMWERVRRKLWAMVGREKR